MFLMTIYFNFGYYAFCCYQVMVCLLYTVAGHRVIWTHSSVFQSNRFSSVLCVHDGQTKGQEECYIPVV